MQTDSLRRKSAEIRDWPLVAWWIRVTSPAPGSPAYGRNPQWREEVASLILLIEIALLMIGILGALDRPTTVIILSASIIAIVVALFLKRAGMMRIAGIIVIIMLEIGLFWAVLSVGTLDGTNFPTFD